MPSPRYTFTPRMHIRSSSEFKAVFDARVRELRGPVMMYAMPNGREYPRLGISIGRAAGNAVRRNRIKRLLREAFRSHQHDLPAAYDFVITVRPHKPFILAEYQKTMTQLMLKLHRAWQAKSRAAG